MSETNLADFRARAAKHPLYTIAVAEVARAMPPEFTDDMSVPVPLLREFMLATWLRGASFVEDGK